MTDVKKAKVSDELQKAKEHFDHFDKQIKEMTHDRMNAAPKEDVEQQTKISQNEIADSKDVYLKPARSLSSREKFNEKFRDEWNFQKEYVYFIAEHREIIGEMIEIWTKPFPGVNAEFWEVPTNKPVWGPRYLAERIKSCTYHRLTMDDQWRSSQGFNGRNVGSSGVGTMYGQIIADTTVQRLDAIPASKKKSIFMGGSSF